MELDKIPWLIITGNLELGLVYRRVSKIRSQLRETDKLQSSLFLSSSLTAASVFMMESAFNSTDDGTRLLDESTRCTVK